MPEVPQGDTHTLRFPRCTGRGVSVQPWTRGVNRGGFAWEPRCPRLQDEDHVAFLTGCPEGLTTAVFCQPHRLHDKVAVRWTAIVFCLLAIYPSPPSSGHGIPGFLWETPLPYHVPNMGSTPTPAPSPG